MTDIKIILQARAGVGDLVEACAKGELPFDELCSKVAAMGYRTTSLYAMVRAAEVGGD